MSAWNFPRRHSLWHYPSCLLAQCLPSLKKDFVNSCSSFCGCSLITFSCSYVWLMKRCLLYVLMFVMCVNRLSAQTADEALNAFLGKLESTTLRSDISLSVADNHSQPFTYNGTLEMRGELFHINVFGSDAAFDGHTLYIYSEDTDELTLSTPTQDELTEANPILFARALRLKSKARYAVANKNTQVCAIDVIPDFKEAGIKKIVVIFDKTTLLPQRIEVQEEGQRIKLLFKKPIFVTAAPVCTISHPDATLIDLR